MTPRAASASLPPWLGHALRTQRGPVPWHSVVRGALAAGPLLCAGMVAGRVSVGVVAALGAMLAGINDRPGSQRVAVRRIGVPALAGAGGLAFGAYVGASAGGAPVLPLLFALLGLFAGAFSAVGPVASSSGTQLLVAAAIGAGMPLPEPGWQRALFFLAGAGWLILLRLVLPSPSPSSSPGKGWTGAGPRGGRPAMPPYRLDRLDGERAAVSAVYEAVAALLDSAGTSRSTSCRAALTAALDQAQDALSGPRLRRHAGSAAERRLHAQYLAALPLGEAATALAWAGEPLPERVGEGPRRLAAAVRDSVPCGPLPAPARSGAGLRALDDALLHAAEAFDSGTAKPPHGPRRGPVDVLRAAAGPGGREYGVRVALCFGASAAVAQALHHPHWYWLPATAVFLVKPDLGPLASRVLCRALGTVLGAVLFAGLAALLPRPAGLVAVVAVCGALIPVATRHFAAQTAVVTVLVLALVMVGGEPQASWGRIGETLLACGIVLLVGHLPWPVQRGGRVQDRLSAARESAQAYLRHVLSGAGDGGPAGADHRAARWALRREAYRTLAEARAAIDLAAAELPTLARHSAGSEEVAATLERLVDTTTACAVHVDDTGRLPRRHAERLDALLAELTAVA
ncbi:FUSC family protein [Streptomyces durmitorensis]|uniref:FUSC family protein n=1 Tax=Streptomyces durmitorensis TaxID=319947 RepID=A0ABY4Q6H2_9ACTN|nr:FUSC family protein [Streptomyces durmitorensis]UQT61778.1 FUSC family protein [Streptomyces durmitorensis]